MNKPTISVVIPLFNKASHILSAIDSIIRQSYQADEIIIVDDGSTDSGVEFIQNREFFSDIEIRIVSQPNQGVSVARNRGAAEARNPYIAFLDADDVWLPLFLEEMVNLIDKFPSTGFYASRYQCKAERGQFLDENIDMTLVAQNGFDPYGMLLKNYFEIASNGDLPFMISSTLVSKTLFEQVGGFPAGEKIGEDQDFFAKVAFAGDMAYCPNINLLYSTVADNKATQQHVPEEECPFSRRLYKKQLEQVHPDSASIVKYCAAHLCHLAKLNIQKGSPLRAQRLLVDPRCKLKPVHRIGLFSWALLSQFVQLMKHWVGLNPVLNK